MKVKDLIKSLESQNPEDEVVMKNLYCNQHEHAYVMKNIRVYKWKGEVMVDGYGKENRDGN
tara:strand:- start:1923 stop:2105 length:183 start_codon:yes stop_codon:yes gene_type:complete